MPAENQSEVRKLFAWLFVIIAGFSLLFSCTFGFIWFGHPVKSYHYDQVQAGMTLDQVNKTLGFAGRETSRESGPVGTEQVIVWSNLDGNLTCHFVNGRLVAKAKNSLWW